MTAASVSLSIRLQHDLARCDVLSRISETSGVTASVRCNLVVLVPVPVCKWVPGTNTSGVM